VESAALKRNMKKIQNEDRMAELDSKNLFKCQIEAEKNAS
jgi:hypothetical protein